MIGLRGSDCCCNFYTTVYIYLLRKSLNNIIAKYSNVKDKIRDSIKKKPHINNVAVYHIFFITLIYATSITFITIICEVSFHFIKS